MFNYESPIKALQDEVQMQVENEIMKAVCRVGITVDKEELLKALKYDRGQYEKGYADGLNTDKWIPCSYMLPECEWGYETKALMYQMKDTGTIEVGYYGEGGRMRDRYFRTYRDSQEGVDVSAVIAWQPLPEPYTGVV